MAYCGKCGKWLSDEAVYCPSCGTSVTFGGNRRTEAFDGTVHKCPRCGQALDAFSAFCPACGYELRDVQAVSSLRELSLRLQEIADNSQKGMKRTLLERLRRDTSDADDRAAALIKASPIPNTREDLIEFIIASASNINVDAFNEMKRGNLSPSDIAMSNAWLSKLEQAYQKASITLGNDEAFERIKALYDNTMKRVSWSRHAVLRTVIVTVLLWTAIIVFCLIMAAIHPEAR